MAFPIVNPFVLGDGKYQSNIFAVRGDLDGAKATSDFHNLKQFVGVLISGSEFLLPVEYMNEIIMINQITYVPYAPKYIEGVVNLRGKIVPAVNLHLMMGYPNVIPTLASRIIISSDDVDVIGLIVDGITNVIHLSPDQITAQSLHTKGNDTELISSIANRQNEVNGILDLIKILEAIRSTLKDKVQPENGPVV